MSRGLFGAASPAGSPFSPLSKGALRFVVLLAAACLVGALVGVLTEPLADKPGAAAAAPEPAAPATAVATAAAQPPAASVVDALAPDLRGLWFAALALVGFAVVAVLLARRARAVRASSGVVHLVDTLALGAGRSVHLLRCEGRKYLIGSSERGIAFLASLPQNEVERALDQGPEIKGDGEGEPAFERVLFAEAARPRAAGATR
jgi:flagellar biogenesis protein FliO